MTNTPKIFIAFLIVCTQFPNLATAQCPAPGCSAVITVTDTGASISNTLQIATDEGTPPFYVGILNNSAQPVFSLGLSSPLTIFAGSTSPGPNASFSNVSPDNTTGIVNFNSPLASLTGATYFQLPTGPGDITACTTLINSSVAVQTNGLNITALFTPNNGYTIAQAAQVCGFSTFNWQQLITNLPVPSPFYDTNFNNLSAPATFNDPPPDGYPYVTPPNAVVLPFYYNLNNSSTADLYLPNHLTQNTLSFFDAPADPCLYGGIPSFCGGFAPPGSYLGFTTHLVGVVGTFPDAYVQDTGIGFSWTDNFNGTSGGLAVTNINRPVDPGSGTGGITITHLSGTSAYQFPKNLRVTNVNGAQAGAPPNLTLLTARQITTTTSGLAYSRATQSFTGTVTITNKSSTFINGPFQVVLLSLPNNVILLNETGSFGGYPYVTVRGQSRLGPGASATIPVQLKNFSTAPLKFVATTYIGGFN